MPSADHDQRPVLKGVDVNLPMMSECSLREWIKEAKRLEEGEAQHRDRFILTGHYWDNDTATDMRARITFENDRVPPNAMLEQVSDVDSVIVIVKDDFPFVKNLSLRYFMLQSHKHTLEDDLHMPEIEVRDAHGEPLMVHPHKTPNARFLEADGHMIVRIYFPRAPRANGQSMTVTVEEHELLYDGAARPAAEEVLPHEISGCWPPTSANEVFRAEDVRNQREAGEGVSGGRGRRMQQTEWPVHSNYLNEWIAAFRRYVDEEPQLEWARSFFFVIQMRGLKSQPGSMHEPPEKPALDQAGNLDPDEPRVTSMEEVMRAFRTSEFTADQCFVDIGMNIKIQTPDGGFACPLPAADAHAAILSHVLDIDLAACEKLVTGTGGHYQRDELAGLKTVAGFRFRVPKALQRGITYVQLYTSDKTGIYNLTLPEHAKRVSSAMVLQDFDKWREHHFQPLMQLFSDSAHSHVMYMRLEVRVDFFEYPMVQLRIPDALLRTWMYAVASEVFWAWKFYRLSGIYSVLREWMKARHKVTRDDLPRYLSLFVVLVWMANCLVNRPNEGKTWDEVRDSSCVHRIASTGKLTPAWPLLAHFLHSLRFVDGRPPRMSGDRLISLDTLLYIFQTDEIELHDMVIGKPATETRGLLAAPRLDEAGQEAVQRHPKTGANRSKTTSLRSEIRLENLFPAARERPNQAAADPSESEDYEERPRGMSVNRILSGVFSDLPLQIHAKSPVNKPMGINWSAIPSGSSFIKPDVFHSLDMLPLIFPSRVVFDNSPVKWRAVVNAYFPTLDESKVDGTKGQQGFLCLKARNAFISAQRDMEESGDRDYNVQLARDYVNRHWAWLPYGMNKNRMYWAGKCNDQSVQRFGPIPDGPWMVLNADLLRER
ncbi:hypothetical protein FRC09_009788 [Ceratobasidium sp. 395]|nr:hypothetical protein FRC09_009788 [Ceratobasidium sp. 395]